MKEYLNSFFWVVAYFTMSALLFSCTTALTIGNKSSNSKNRYQKVDFDKKLKSIPPKQFPPNLTDLNHNSRASHAFIEPNVLTDLVVENAKEYLRSPYRYGGNSLKGIDCSALVKQAFEPYKLLPRASAMQAKMGMRVSKSELLKGDLLFFSINQRHAKKQVINHVGIVSDKNDRGISFIHASRSHGVMVSNLKNTYWSKRFIMARRILKDTYLEAGNIKKMPSWLIVN